MKWKIGIGIILASTLVLCGRKMPAQKPAQDTIPTELAQAAQTVSLPCVLPEAQLIAQTMASYEGEFPGDGEYVADAAALMVCNTGTDTVRAALVNVVQGQRQLFFYLTFLPPGGKVLVVEQNGQLFSREAVTDCRVMLLERTGVPDCSGFTVEETDEGLQITNNTHTHDTVRVYYKSFYAPEDFYLGGITRSVIVEDLMPGEQRSVLPPHYAPGYSKAVWVEKEDDF